MILVTGATGNVGREVVEVLLEDGKKVVAVTCNPAAELPGGAHVVSGDPSHPQTLTSALCGVKAVLISPGGLGDATAGAATAELLALAVEQSVERMVALSAVIVQYAAGYRRFADAFKAVEDAIKASGLQWAFLRSADYAANTLAWAPQIRSASVVRGAYGDAATSTVHERDVAAIAARALVNSAYAGHSYVGTGPQSLTQRDKGRLIGEAIGKELSFEELPPEQLRQAMLAQGLPEDVPDSFSAPWPTTPSSRDRRRAPWSRFSAAPHSPSPNGQPNTPPPSGTDGNATAIMSVSQQETID